MLNENAKKWVAALRSGDYKQGQNYLCRDDCYCCFGVACELFLESGGDLEKDSTKRVKSYKNLTGTLPRDVQNWLGLQTQRGIYSSLGNSLEALNDSGFSFNQIADIIEQESEGLFV